MSIVFKQGEVDNWLKEVNYQFLFIDLLFCLGLFALVKCSFLKLIIHYMEWHGLFCKLTITLRNQLSSDLTLDQSKMPLNNSTAEIFQTKFKCRLIAELMFCRLHSWIQFRTFLQLIYYKIIILYKIAIKWRKIHQSTFISFLLSPLNIKQLRMYRFHFVARKLIFHYKSCW